MSNTDLVQHDAFSFLKVLFRKQAFHRRLFLVETAPIKRALNSRFKGFLAIICRKITFILLLFVPDFFLNKVIV